MKFSLASVVAACVLALGAMDIASAGLVYDEAVSGDLSNSGLAPTVVAVAAGSNLLFGVTGKSGLVVDRDYFRFTVAPGYQLTQIVLQPGTVSGGPDPLLAQSFFAVQGGTAISESSVTAAGLLGWTHYNASLIGVNLLPLMGAGLGATGFSGALAAGDYAFRVQDTATTALTLGGMLPRYGFDFVLTDVPSPVPLPPSAALLLAGMAVMGWSLRKSQRAKT
jgi:hypothetical protein